MIALDANGADGGPGVIAAGARESGERVLLFGPRDALGPGEGRVEVFDAPETIAAGSEPVRAVRSQPLASIVQAAGAVADGRAGALVSAGSTGPTLAAATLAIKRIRGVHRPALAVLLPIPTRPVLLLDAGASIEARPEHLVQFAHMGAAFMRVVQGVERPRVGLLSVGEEAGKGTPGVLEAGERLTAADAGGLDYAGNLEGFDLAAGSADVVVTDGFTGNVVLKTLEGAMRFMRRAVVGALTATEEATQASEAVLPLLMPLATQMDPDSYGGALLLGVDGVCIISHGSSSSGAMVNAVKAASDLVELGLVDRLRRSVKG
ncbi:MAG: phosphate acyltransferase [Thermoleophilaceae bacterium]